MKRVLTILAALALALPALAQQPFRGKLIEVDTGAKLYGNTTVKDVYGYVETVEMDSPNGTATGQVVLYAVPPLSTMGRYLIATNTVTADKRIYPTRDSTTTDGTANTSDPPARFLLWGDTVTMVVTNASATNLTWQVYVKTSDR